MKKKNANFLHQNIPEGDILLIEGFLKSQTIDVDDKYYNEELVSAAAVAIKCDQLKIYNLLLSRGVCLGPHESSQELSRNLSVESKKEIFKIHRAYLIDSLPKHVRSLIAQSRLSHDASSIDGQDYDDKISKAFKDLNSSKWIDPILKVVSTSAKLKIVFDFNRDSVNNLDPMKHKGVLGTSYFNDNHIYIGAKKLLKEDNCQVLGVLAHELCHFAMDLVYDNRCKPYTIGNQMKEEIFESIVQATELKKDDEEIIKWAYISPVVQHEELIVRVPHLAAFYKDDEDKFNKLYDNFKELFEFFEKNTLVDIQHEYPLMEYKRSLIDLNGTMWNSNIETIPEVLRLDSDSHDKFLFISSNFIQLTMCAISQTFKVEIGKDKIIKTELKTLKDDIFFETAVKAFSLCSKPKLIINCDGQGIDEVENIIKRFNEKQINQRIVFLVDQRYDSLSNSSLEIKHSWSHLMEAFQQKLLQKEINFQGNKIQLRSLFKDLSLIESIPFNDLFGDRRITIGKIEKDENFEKFIERRFLSPDSKKNNPISWSEGYDIEHDINYVIDCAEKDRMILLSDEPGMGKSTTFKMIQVKLIEKYQLRWIVLLDLKLYFAGFQSINNKTIKLKSRDEITTFLCQKILKIENFEVEVFAHLFHEDRVIFLMDGLDEICPSLKNPVYEFMSAIKIFSSNQLWVSTRPHLLKELIKKFDPFTFHLKPFTENDLRVYFKKIFIAGDKENSNIELKLKEVDKYIKQLRNKAQGCDLFSNPLLFKMIAECQGDQSMNILDANLYSVYDRFTMKMIERCMDKGPEAQKSVTKTVGNLNIVEIYQKMAFKICFNDKNIKNIVSQMIEQCFRNTFTLSRDDIFRVGLVFSGKTDCFQFIHRTFAEFYAAKFFHDMIFQRKCLSENNLELILEVFLIALKQKEYEMIMKLLEDSLGSCNTQLKIFAKYSEEKLCKILHQMIEGGHLNLIKILLNYSNLKPSKLLLLKNEKQGNFLFKAVEYQSINFIQPFLCLLAKFLDTAKLKWMLSERDKVNEHILHKAVKNCNSEVLGIVIEMIHALNEHDFLLDLMMQSNLYGENFILWVISSKSSSHVERLLEFCEELLESDQLKKLMFKRNIKIENILHEAAKNIDTEVLVFVLKKIQALYGHDSLLDLMMQSNLYGENFILWAISSKSSAHVERLLEFCEELLESGQLKKLMFKINNKSESILHEAAKNLDPEVLVFVLKKIQALYGHDSLLDLWKKRKEENACFHSLSLFK